MQLIEICRLRIFLYFFRIVLGATNMLGLQKWQIRLRSAWWIPSMCCLVTVNMVIYLCWYFPRAPHAPKKTWQTLAVRYCNLSVGPQTFTGKGPNLEGVPVECLAHDTKYDQGRKKWMQKALQPFRDKEFASFTFYIVFTFYLHIRISNVPIVLCKYFGL